VTAVAEEQAPEELEKAEVEVATKAATQVVVVTVAVEMVLA